MADMMTFPDTWEEFEEYYGITDREQIYTNGARLISSFRVKQWLDHLDDYVPRNFHDKTCEEMAKRHQEEIADMVSVVRCKECRYCKRKKGTFKGEPIIFYRCEENNRDVENDDYCSWGERKSDE